MLNHPLALVGSAASACQETFVGIQPLRLTRLVVRVISRNLKLGWGGGLDKCLRWGVQTCAKGKFTLKTLKNRINYIESG